MIVTSLSRYDWAARQITELLATCPSRDVADIGAGEALMRPATLKAGGHWTGYDLFPASADIAKWDLDEPPSDVQVGMVLMLDVLEHLRNPWLAMRHVSEALLPGGVLLLTTPNPRWSRSRIHALHAGLPICFTEQDLALNHHVFTPWPHIVSKMLADVGLTQEAVATLDGPTGWPGRPFNARYPARLLGAMAMKWLERRDRSACGMSYALVARKAHTGT